MARNQKYFPNDLDGDFIGKNQWRLNEDFIYLSPKYGKIVVPKDFVTNGSSIPRFLWTIVGSPWGNEHGYIATIHDYCFHVKLFSLKDCNKIFKEGLGFSDVGRIKRRILYSGVKAGGWKAYYGYKFFPRITKNSIGGGFKVKW